MCIGFLTVVTLLIPETTDNKRKLYITASTKLLPQFLMTDDDIDTNSSGFLETNYNAFFQQSRLKHHLTSHCMYYL